MERHALRTVAVPGWLAFSLISRVDNILSWVQRYGKLAPMTAIEIESVRFDSQPLQTRKSPQSLQIVDPPPQTIIIG
jgi:hypothetical protein